MSGRHVTVRFLRNSLWVLMVAVAAPLEAEFALNFTPSASSGGGGWGGGGGAGGWADVECNSSSTGGSGGTGGGGGWGGGSGFRGCGTGYFLQETTSNYYHVIVGDPATDFALEFYIQSDGGDSASGGDFSNWRYPLSSSVSLSGNGTGDATRVHMRQLIQDGGMVQDTLKARNATKPRISQDINDGGLSSQFVVDMSNSNYSTRTTPGTIVNRQSLVASDGMPAGFADFDISKDSQRSRVTAGQFSRSGGVGTSYSYLYGGFDLNSVKWISYCDPAQNPDHKCDLAGGTSSGSSRGGWGGGGGGW